MKKPLRILFLEDNPADAELNAEQLRHAGFDPQWQRVETEFDYLAGLDALPEVILADYSLLQFDGLTALKLLQERQLDIPFILVSGMLGEETAVEAMKYGATDYLLKDRIARLGAAVEHALEEKRLRTEKRETLEELRRSDQFARSQRAEAEAALEAVPANIAILDADGMIIRVNKLWIAFSSQNDGHPDATDVGTNYLTVCDSATGAEAAHAQAFAAGIRSVISGSTEHFSMEYPCHSAMEQRWFVGHVKASHGGGDARAVVAHVDITALKHSEEQIRQLNEALEMRVFERTIDLRAAIELLETEIAERHRLEREILEISEREQCRLGQDLHDGLGQELAGIAMIGDVLAKQLKHESHPLADTADEIAEHIRESIHAARCLAMGLYPVELTRGGLLLALLDLANRTSQLPGISCELRQSGPEPALTQSSEIHLYRIVQECITNAIKHARANRIIVESQADDENHTFSVTDDGNGFKMPADCDGMGLHLMQYRANVIGAEIEVTKPADGGCRVTCRLRR